MLALSPAQIKQTYAQAMTAQKAGRLDEALGLFARVLQARPDLPEALFQTGRIHAARGDRAKAETALRKALAARPQEPAIWQGLAAVLQGGARKKLMREAAAAGIPIADAPDIAPLLRQIESGKAETAEAAALALVRQHPEAAEPALALGLARLAQRKFSGAVMPLEKAVERAPEDARALAGLGEARVELALWSGTEEILDRAAAQGADVTHALVQLLRETARPDEAGEILGKALKQNKKTPALHLLHGDILAQTRDSKGAIAAYERAIALGVPKSCKLDLAATLNLEGEGDAALAMAGAYLKETPDNPNALILRGQARQSLGDMADAQQDFLAALDQDPKAAEAYRAYFASGKTKPDDPVFSMLQEQMADISLPRRTRRVMAFAMAKALEDQGEYDQVFAYLHRANRLARAEYPYRVETDIEAARSLAAIYRALSDRTAPAKAPSDPTLFVSGLPRSGTTLVETILAAHSRVTAGGEMPYAVRALNLPISALKQGDAAPDFAQAGQLYLRGARRRSGADDILTDKAISTFSRIGFAAMALPGAKFLMLKRDPRDVGLSIYRNMFPEGKQLYASDLADIGRYARMYDAMIDLWAEALPDQVHIVDYEALTSEPEPNIRALVAAAGLDWEDACLEPHKAKRRVDTLSFAQVRQPIYRGSVAAWKRYETELEPLLEALEQLVQL